jgi:hypothetical protein
MNGRLPVYPVDRGAARAIPHLHIAGMGAFSTSIGRSSKGEQAMSSVDSRLPCSSKPKGDTNPERRGLPVVPTLIGALVVVNVASVILTLIE